MDDINIYFVLPTTAKVLLDWEMQTNLSMANAGSQH